MACALWCPRVADADDTVFDFVAPRADQVGDYEPDARALVSGGVGTLRPLAGWFDEDWRYRLPLSVVNPGTAALAEWQVALIIDAAATAAEYDVFHLAQPTGADLRVVGAGGAIDRMSLGLWDEASNRGRIWFQLPTIAPGASDYFLYFGNYQTAPIDDPLAVFSYSAPFASRYALEPAGSILILASLVDDNDYATGTMNGTLAAGDVANLGTTWITGQSIASSGPIDVQFAANTAVEGAPVAFARTLHGIAVPRGAINEFRMIAPFADTTVTVAIDGVASATVGLTAGVAATWAYDVPDGSAVTFTSGSPILVAHRSDDNNDGYVLPPPAAEVWGFRSGTPRVLAFAVDTDITAYDSAGTVTTQTIPAGQIAALAGNGTSGSAEAMRIVATEAGTATPAPITVLSAGDGDGGDAMVFHPTSDLGRSWVVPSASTFVLVALSRAGATCVLTPSGGGAPITKVADPAVTSPFPGRVKFGADTGTNVLAGSLIACDAHGFAYHEDVTNEDERNLYPMEAHRKRGAAEQPNAALGDLLETRYDAAVAGTIQTPEAVAPTAIIDWTDFRVASTEPTGTEILYQVSIDGGSTWLVPSGTSWAVAPDHLFGASANTIRDALGTLDTSTGRIRVHTILQSDDGVTRPEVDAIRVFYDSAGAADRLRWDPLPPTIVAGTGVQVTITAVDTDGTTITGINGDVSLTPSHSGQVLPATVTMTGGRAELDLKLTGTADDVTIRAVGPGGLVGISSMFDLVAPDGARLEYVSGSDQFGALGTLLGEPFVARVVDAADFPIGGVQVTFAVTEGGGALEPGGASIAVITDDAGEARAFLRLGNSLGAQRVRCEGAGGTLEFVARADEPGAGDDGGGCCDTSPASPTPVGALLLAVLVAGALLRPRRRA